MAMPSPIMRPTSSRARVDGEWMPSHPLTVSMALFAAFTAASTRLPAAEAMPEPMP